MPFPIIKLVYLFAKQVSKPLATRATSYMKEKPFLRKYLMIPLAQGNIHVSKTAVAFGNSIQKESILSEMRWVNPTFCI